MGDGVATGSISPNIEDISRPMGSCVLQISPNAKSETVISSMSTSSASGSAASSTIPPINQSSNDPHLAEKIAIPVGTVVGVVSIGGATYLIYKKRKKKNTTNSSEQRNVELVSLPERSENTSYPLETDSHEVVASSSQSQPRTEEENKQLKEEMQKLKARLEGLETQIQVPPK